MDKALAAFTQAVPPLAAYSQLKDRARRERCVLIDTVLAALFVGGTPLVEETADGLFIRSSMYFEGEDSQAYRAVVRVSKYAVESNVSIPQILRLSQQCTQRDLRNPQPRLTLYTAETPTVTGGSMHHRTAKVTQLKDVVVNQVQLAMAEGNYKHNGTKRCIWAVVVPDGTPLWKTSVSKADFFVHFWEEGVKGAGHIVRWAMCLCMDGPDDAGCLLALDDIGQLNKPVHCCVAEGHHIFHRWRFVVVHGVPLSG